LGVDRCSRSSALLRTAAPAATSTGHGTGAPGSRLGLLGRDARLTLVAGVAHTCAYSHWLAVLGTLLACAITISGIGYLGLLSTIDRSYLKLVAAQSIWARDERRSARASSYE
jgi:hypothetical protein